ncbi:MAG: hypothetical protein OXC03_01370 [Flavobacteriaceae bacterium]|nr:hypothetical protein [Flavobacteriaceae bacterium]
MSKYKGVSLNTSEGFTLNKAFSVQLPSTVNSKTALSLSSIVGQSVSVSTFHL